MPQRVAHDRFVKRTFGPQGALVEKVGVDRKRTEPERGGPGEKTPDRAGRAVEAGEGRLMACLDKHEKDVSQRCKQALKDVGLKLTG